MTNYLFKEKDVLLLIYFESNKEIMTRNILLIQYLSVVNHRPLYKLHAHLSSHNEVPKIFSRSFPFI